MQNITATVEKENGEGLSFEDAYLTELGGQIAHTVSTKEPHFSVNHCNMAIEIRDLQTMEYTEVKRIKIHQATEQGFEYLEIGGGGGLELSNKPNKKRKSNRERKDLPNLDKGVYP